MEFLLSQKEECNYVIFRKIELEIIMLSGISLTKKDKYCIFSLICGIWEKKKHMKVKGDIRM
jgi:hypothetical protein